MESPKEVAHTQRRVQYLIRTRTSRGEETKLRAGLGFCTSLSVTNRNMKSTYIRLEGTSLQILVLLLWRGTQGKPIDEQRIYFPGEPYQEPLETRSYSNTDHGHQGNENNNNQYHPTYRHGHQQQEYQSASYGNVEGSRPVHIHHETINHADHDSMLRDENHTGELRQTMLNREPVREALQYKTPPGYNSMQHIAYASGQPLTGSVGDAPQNTFSHQQFEREERNHWQKAPAPHSPKESYQEEGGGVEQAFNHAYENHKYDTRNFHPGNSNTIKGSSEDLTHILNQPSTSSMQEKKSELHPNIKQAIDNIMKDLEQPRLQKADQKVSQSIHHVHKQHNENKYLGESSTPTKASQPVDNMNLFGLLDQLHQLENSPGHKNITWCEEKIKEFLQALHHKQESGIFINEKVQQETLHQVLTSVENSNEYNSKKEVYETPFKKVTFRPLGSALLENHHNQQQTGDIGQELEQNGSRNDHNISYVENYTGNHGEDQATMYAHTFTTQQSSIIYGIPQQEHVLQPQIMAQKHQHESESPPFISDQHNLPETNPEIPGLMQSASHEVSISHEETEEIIGQKAPQQTPNMRPEKFSNSKEGSQNIYGHNTELVSLQSNKSTERNTGNTQEDIFSNDQNIPEGFQPRPHGQLDLELPDISQGDTSKEYAHQHFGHSDLQYQDSTKASNESQITKNTEDKGKKNEDITAGNHGIVSHNQKSISRYEETFDQKHKQLQAEEEEGEKETLSSGQGEEQGLIEVSPEIDPNTPQGFQPRPLGQLDLQLPEYHYSGTKSMEKGEEENNNLQKIGQDHLPNKNVLSSEVNLSKEESNVQDLIHHKVQSMTQVTHTKTEEEGSDLGQDQKEPNQTLHEKYSDNFNNLNNQQVNYETLIEELIELESIPGHQAIDKCEEKILEFLEILKYQQEVGFGRNQQELAKLHQTLIEQTQNHREDLKKDTGASSVPPHSFWKRLKNKIKTTYQRAKDTAKQAVGY